MSSKTETRTRNWTFIIYPESVPVNWRDFLDELHIPWVESPLHDKDFNPDGEIKKSHWHILIMSSTLKSYKQMLEITRKLNAPNPQKVSDVKGIVRYFAHLDNPEKFQYDKTEIIEHSGADVTGYLSATTKERYQLINEMMEYADINNITEMKDLLNYARIHRFEDWFPLLCDNSAYIVEMFVKSNRYDPKIKKAIKNDSSF